MTDDKTMIAFKCSIALKREIEKACLETEQTTSQFVRLAIKKALRKTQQ